MALPTLQSVKDYLRVETSAADQDLSAIRTRAEALVRQFIDRPIEATAKTYTLYADGAGSGRPITRLFIPDYPVKLTSPAPEITDADGTVVDATTYRINAATGEVRCKPGYSFANWPYEVDATVGLATAGQDFDLVSEPLIAAAILDACADFYQNRNPRAQAEGVGGGVYTQWSALTELPARTKAMLLSLRRSGGV